MRKKTGDYFRAPSIGNKLVRLIKAGKEEEAGRLFMAALQVCSGQTFFVNQIGDHYSDICNFKAAREYYRISLSIKPDDVNIMVRLGIACYEAGSNAEAETWFQIARNNDPKNVKLLNLLANSLIKQNKLEEAEAFLTEGLAIDPRNVVTLCAIGGVLERQGRLEEAGTVYQIAYNIDPDDRIVITKHGKDLSRRNMYTGALAVFQKGAKLHPDDEIIGALLRAMEVKVAAVVRCRMKNRLGSTLTPLQIEYNPYW